MCLSRFGKSTLSAVAKNGVELRVPVRVRCWLKPRYQRPWRWCSVQANSMPDAPYQALLIVLRARLGIHIPFASAREKT